MKRRPSEDSWQALNSVTDAAERFMNRSPRLKRLEAERQALLDAIRQGTAPALPNYDSAHASRRSTPNLDFERT